MSDCIRVVEVVVPGAIAVIEVGPLLSTGGEVGGNSSAVIQGFPAGIVVSALRAVRLDAGVLRYVSADDAAVAHSCIGISLQSAAIGGAVNVQMAGIITDSGWSWTPDQPVYCGVGGALTQAPPQAPAHAFLLRVGVAVAAQSMVVQIERPIIIT